MTDNILYFDNDNDFYQFCVIPELVPVEDTDEFGNKSVYADFNFTSQYNDAVANGTMFMIKDENSQIFKRNAVSYRTITKPVSNLKQYFEF